MRTRLDTLLLKSLNPQGLTLDEYVSDLQRPVGAVERTFGLASQRELVRITRTWSGGDSPLNRCRLVCVLNHLKHSLPYRDGSLGDRMLKVVESSIPSRVQYIVRLYEMGFSCFLFAFDLYDLTMSAFRAEKRVDLDHEFQERMFRIYILSVYHMGRSRMLATEHREVILAGVHDSYGALFCRPKGYEIAAPDEFVKAYQEVVDQWVNSAGAIKSQSPSYALIRIVFNLLGLTSPMDRMACAALLEASANHLLELSEVLQQQRMSAGL